MAQTLSNPRCHRFHRLFNLDSAHSTNLEWDSVLSKSVVCRPINISIPNLRRGSVLSVSVMCQRINGSISKRALPRTITLNNCHQRKHFLGICMEVGTILAALVPSRTVMFIWENKETVKW